MAALGVMILTTVGLGHPRSRRPWLTPSSFVTLICMYRIGTDYSHVTCVQYARFWTSNAVTSERLRITSPTPSAGLTRRQGKAILIQQDPYYRTLRMCSQDSVVEGVDGDDEVSDHQYVSPCVV